MKQWFLVLLTIFTFILVGYAGASPNREKRIISLDQAIREAAQQIISDLDEGTSVFVLHFNSSSPDFNEHFIREMEHALAGKKLKVLENRELQEIREKINKEYTDAYHLNDETIVSMTKQLGTQVVIIGELHNINNTYRFYVRAVMPETGDIKASYRVNLRPNERILRELMAGRRPHKLGETDNPSTIVTTQGTPNNESAPPLPPPPRPEPVLPGMVWIRGGSFLMGSPANEGYSNERPQRRVTVSDFYLGRYEVTQKEYQEIMGTNPSSFKGDNLPVENVSWFDAVEYCNRLSRREGLAPAYTISGTTVTWNRNANGYRLPTEAEWEYACRAGTTTPYNTGNTITTSQANFSWSAQGTTPVGTYSPNAWGLYDMHGNVWEWCYDRYGSYSTSDLSNPLGASSGSDRVIRGGSWSPSAQYLRSAYRYYGTPAYRYGNLGFRLVRP